jgi:hypothetical protein
MSNEDLAVCVCSERPIVGLQRYELSVYRIGGEFYASWFCPNCGYTHETSRFHTQALAQDEGMAAIEAHHAAQHGVRRE